MPATQPSPDPDNAATGFRSARLARTGVLVLLGSLVGLVAWAALAPLDEGVPTPASVSVDTKRKAVQHQQGGIVRRVLVREGQSVKRGEPLVELEDGLARANFEEVRQRYLSLRAMEARLLAEQRGRDRIDYPAELIEAASDPLVARHMAAQGQLFETRRRALQADLKGIAESVRGQEESLRAFEGMVTSRRAQLALLEEQVAGLRDLVRDGFAPRNQMLELQRQSAEVATAMADLQGNMARARQAVAELRQRAVAREQEYRKETDTQLADVSRQVQADTSRFAAVRAELERTVIRSPAEGQVVGLAFQTVGGVITPGQKLMDVVPADEALVLEARVPPHLIDRVRVGQGVDVRFSAFAQSPRLVVAGRVVSLSTDLLTEPTPQGNVSYFLARLEVTPDGMRQLGARRMQPGMPAEVVIRTGERTVIAYLLQPLTRRVAAAMKEP